MAIVVTIDSVDRTSKTLLNQLHIDMSLGSEWSATFPVRDTLSTSSAYRPALDEEVTIADGATTLFHGTIKRLEDKPIAAPGTGTLTVITAAAYSGVVDQVIVNETYAAGETLEDVVTDLRTTYLNAYGITLDASMATGATLEAQTFEGVTMREVLNHLSAVTGWLWRITPSDELQFFAAGGKTASYSLTAANRQSVGPITWEKTREKYVNSVTLRYGTETQVSKTFTATGTGAISSWVLDYDPAINVVNGFMLSRGYVTEGSANLTLSQPGGGGFYTWTAATNTLTRASGALGNGVVISLVYTAQFPQTVLVEDSGEISASGKYAAIFEAPDIFDKDAATELATGLLRRYTETPQWVHISTRQGFVMPGDQITLTFADRIVSGSHIITQVRVKTIAKGTALYELTCLSGAERQETWTDRMKSLVGSSGSNAAGGTISGAAVPNFSGRFSNDVSAFNGGAATDDHEVSLINYTNSAGFGPAVQLGRNDQDFRWVITADADHGSTPGDVGKLRFHPARRASSIECAMSLAEPDTGGTDEFVLLPGENADLYLGDYAALMSGLSPSDSRIEGILTQDIMAVAGVYERSRTARMGEWATVTFAAGNFTGSGAQTWTLTSPDQVTFRWSIVGKTMTIAFSFEQTSVGGTPDTELRFAIPGGFTAAQTAVVGTIRALDNGTDTVGFCGTVASAAYIRCWRGGFTNWAAATNATYVQGTATIEVQ